MNFDWSEYLNLAQELAGQATSPSSQEAKLRSAISRAYYAAFCKARNHLRDKEGHVIPSGGEAHQYVQNQFQRGGDKVRRKVGANLTRLHIYRKNADYEDRVTKLRDTTEYALKVAERILSNLCRL